MYPILPFEFNVIGTPVSLQSDNARAKQEWKEKVAHAALEVVGCGQWAFYETRLAVTMYYFPQSPMPGDLDNIIKLTLDALKPNVFLDDSLVDRIVVQRFNPTPDLPFASPSNKLIAAMEHQEPVLYMRLSEVPLEGIAE